MKKRLFATLLMLCSLVAALAATVSAAEPAFYYTDTKYTEKSILFAFEANYRCVRNVVTAVKSTDPYKVTNINSWTSEQIEFQIEVTSVRCAGDSSVSHNAHSNDVAQSSRTVTCTGQGLCHKTLNLTAKITSVVYGWDDALEFTVTTNQPRYTLTKHLQASPTCTEYGYTQTCYECPGCGEFFADENAAEPLNVSKVRIDKTSHNYNENGVCQNCGNEAEAYIRNYSDGKATYYETVEAALEDAYGDSNNRSVWITRYERKDTINLTSSYRVYVSKDVTIPEIRMSAPAESSTVFDITNRGGTISKISFNDITSGNSVQATIYNDSGSIETITPASSGTQALDVTNRGSITLIDIPDNGSLRMEIKNSKDAEINTIQSPRNTAAAASVTIQNNGTITWLVAKKPIQLQSGIGTYTAVTTEYTGSKLGELLADGCKFYQYDALGNKSWFGAGSTSQGSDHLVVSTPPFSVTVTGPTGFQSDESGGYSLTLATEDVQNKTLSTSLSYPNANMSLSSKDANFTYGWYYASDAAARWKTSELPLNKLAVGVNHLTLRVKDDRYDYTHSINVTVTITSTDAEPISLKVPEGSFTKMYDGTVNVPENLTIGFVDSKGATVPLTVDTDYTVVTAAYNSANCKEATTITVQVELTTEAARIYDLKEKTFRVKGTITKFEPEEYYPFFYLHVKNSRANVGDRIMDYLTETNVEFKRASHYDKIPDPLDAKPTITYYRMRTDDIYDPTTDEKITENSIFAYEGSYKIYAVIGETENYAELLTDCTTLTAKPVLGRHTHCLYGHKDCTAEELLTYTGFSGSSLSPNGSANQRSYYLNAQRSIVNLDLILRKLSGSSSENPSLDLCLYGKTLRADSNYPAQFRVSNKWHLTLTDCIGTGVLKGTNVDDEHGGCLYVADATAELYNIKVTGGSSSKLGGAIVVDKNGTLNLYSGEISGNHVTSGKGGAIYIKSGGVVNIYGGTIKNNHVYSGNGGAIYVAKGGTLNLYGGEITGNTASGLGGGIYVEEGGTLNIQGAPVVTGNTAGGKDSNVYLAGGLLSISDQLGSNAQIGISVNALSYPALFARSTADYSAHFIPDDADTFVLRTNGGLTLAAKPSATRSGTELTVTTGKNYAPDACILFVAEYGKDGRMLAVQSKTVEPGTAAYTFTVKNSGAKLKCFLLRKDTYTPLFEAFTPQ